ncbi:GNAT family N-acetyltransferase [Candidatus Roizmanbacteria bacterium]|nr:GNAT family N-acetyltransferase [Candidatus Roizmanbacteria bacterium]
MPQLIQDTHRAIAVMHSVGQWMVASGKNPSQWWVPENLNEQFLSQYAKQNEFYVLELDGKDAGAAIFQMNQNSQDWKSIDSENAPKALYIHWLCVAREFAGQNVPKMIVKFAEKIARENEISFLRVDTNADEVKLCTIYERLGFVLVGTEKENYRTTAFYQKTIS